MVESSLALSRLRGRDQLTLIKSFHGEEAGAMLSARSGGPFARDRRFRYAKAFTSVSRTIPRRCIDFFKTRLVLINQY